MTLLCKRLGKTCIVDHLMSNRLSFLFPPPVLFRDDLTNVLLSFRDSDVQRQWAVWLRFWVSWLLAPVIKTENILMSASTASE